MDHVLPSVLGGILPDLFIVNTGYNLTKCRLPWSYDISTKIFSSSAFIGYSWWPPVSLDLCLPQHI